MEKMLLTNDLTQLQKDYEFVDLGLSVKWATYNVGATSMEESGLFFQFGDKQGYKVIIGDLENEKKCINSIKSIEPKMKQFALDFSDYEKNYFSNDSIIRIPTKEECEELLNGTTSVWVDNYNGSNVNGCIFISKIDKSKFIFIPASSIIVNGIANNLGLYGYIWTSSLYEYNDEFAYILYFNSINNGVTNNFRCLGMPIRLVCN